MSGEKVTVTAEPLSRFREATDGLEVYDPQGRMLGYFLPPDLYREWLYAWVKARIEEEPRVEYPDDGRPPMTTSEAIVFLEGVARSTRGGL